MQIGVIAVDLRRCTEQHHHGGLPEHSSFKWTHHVAAFLAKSHGPVRPFGRLPERQFTGCIGKSCRGLEENLCFEAEFPGTITRARTRSNVPLWFIQVSLKNFERMPINRLAGH